MNSPSDAPAGQAPAAKKSRTPLLVGLLVLVIAALAYDKKVSMPAVRAAFDAVEAENTKINESSELRAMTSEDVQRVLNRQPNDVIKKNNYTIERYGYMRGIPFLHHNYYAVYTSAEGGKLTFQTHAPFTPDEFYLGKAPETSAGAAGAGPPAPSTDATKAADSSAAEPSEGASSSDAADDS